LHLDTAPRVSLSVEAWPAVDMSMSLLAVVEKIAHRRLDAGSEWRDRAAALPDGFLGRIDRYNKEVWINLLGLPLDEPDGRDGAGLVAVVERLPAEDVVRYLVGYYRRVFRRETPAAVMDAAVGGDRAARREFRRTSFADLPPWRECLRFLLSRPAAEIRADLAELLSIWHADVYGPREAEIRAALERDVTIVRRAAEDEPIESVVERAVPGVTFVPEVGQTSVILAASWTIKPLWAVVDHRAANLFAYPAGTGSPDAATPPARLVALGKAIGDETRLRILRQLATEPATPPDLAERLGMPRTTLLHHLSILRRAGLIAVQVHDSAYHTFVVRDEHLGDVSRLLEEFLG